ncbi:MAG: GTPase HflX [Candidatus Heimdallarchaeota archaeon]|nr:GTPase HflX [Candidatus Heimdallarchaeota archaeon]
MSTQSNKKKAILVEAVTDRKEGDHLAELTELAFISGYEVVDRIVQNIDQINPAYLFGKGKATEIKARVKELNADIVIIENKLDTIHYDNLTSMWHVPIIDRLELILEIFIQRAGTQEALTQIRLAALKKTGTSRFESHRSIVAKNALVRKLEKKLELIKISKDIRMKRRLHSGFDLVAIAGYTNAGKSTLMNCLTSADVEVSGRMFTTLDTVTRSSDALGRKILVTDTVGFISRLPHSLIDAFYATLKEINQADLILLLIDGNDSIENIKRKSLASINTLGAIEAENIPLIPVLNKMDISQNFEEKFKTVETLLGKKVISISAKNQINIDVLKKEILNILETYHFHLKIPNTNEGMSLISQIHNKTRITNELYHPQEIELIFETNERLASYLYNIIIKSKIDIEFVNQAQFEKQFKKHEHKDKFTIMTSDTGEEFIVFDMNEDEIESENDQNIEHENLGLKTSIDDIKKER